MRTKAIIITLGLIITMISGVRSNYLKNTKNELENTNIITNDNNVIESENVISEGIAEELRQEETTNKEIDTQEEMNVENNNSKGEIVKNNSLNEKKTTTNANKKQKVQQKTNSTATNNNSTKTTNNNKTQTTTTNKSDNGQTNINKNTQQIDLSKYSYYEKATDGSYKAFIEDKAEMNKLKNLIDTSINNFGYKNIKVFVDSSLSRSGASYFTANKTNVDSAVYDSEGFNIYYYAVKEYIITKNGTESYFQTRSYIKVK